MDFKNLPELVKIATIKTNSQMMVNNQIIQQEVSVIACPKCGRALINFNNNFPRIEVVKYLVENRATLESQFAYCPSCGKKLAYHFSIIDGEQFVTFTEPAEKIEEVINDDTETTIKDKE